MAKSRPWLFIANPNAGRGKTRKKLSEITEYLTKKEFRYEMVLTQFASHATEITKEFIEKGYDKIVAIGGDGTIHEVINGIMQTKNHRKIKFGIVPLGGGNDFVQSLPVHSNNWKKAIDTLRLHELQPIDIGKTPICYFVNSLGFGFDASAARNAAKIKKLNGFARYLGGVFMALIKFKPYKIAIRTDTELFRDEVLMLSIGNGRFCGGGFQLTPDADVSDGKFDVCFVKKTGIPTILRVLPSIPKGKHTTHPVVSMYKTKIIEVLASEPIPYYIDGEVPTDLWEGIFKIELIHDAVQLFMDPSLEKSNG